MSTEFAKSLISSITTYVNENATINKKDLLKVIRTVFDEKKEKKPLNGYQLYMKEKYPILLEKAKEKGEVNSKEIMIQIGRLWKEKKEGKEEEVVEVKENPKKDAKEKKVKAKK